MRWFCWSGPGPYPTSRHSLDATSPHPKATASCPAPRSGDMREMAATAAEPGEPVGADCGRGLWLAATLADELSITSGPDSTIVSLFMRLE